MTCRWCDDRRHAATPRRHPQDQRRGRGRAGRRREYPDTRHPGRILLESLRVGLGLVDEAGYWANAVLLNALDWAALDMTILPVSRDGANVSNVFWGLRAVAVPQIPKGTAYVGDFAEGMTFFDRNQVRS